MAVGSGAGARVVLFTDPWLSPVAGIADALLPEQVAGPSPFPSLAATAAVVVETLLTAIAGELGESARAHFQRFDDIADRWIRRWPEPEGSTDGAGSRPAPRPGRRRRRMPSGMRDGSPPPASA
jgi:hypothetical protein